MNEGNHETDVLFIYADRCDFSRLRDRTDYSHDHNHYAGGDYSEPGARSYSPPPAAAGSCRNSDSSTRAGLCLDNRLLAMDWHDLRVGAGHMGSSPAAGRSLGRRPLGASVQWLGMGLRPLAIAAADLIVSERVTIPKLSRKPAAQRLSRQIRSRIVAYRR